MALSPFDKNKTINTQEVSSERKPSKTYEFDFETGSFTGKMIDDVKATKQFVTKALKTARYRYLAYDDQYGNELIEFIGKDLPIELLETEVPRLIEEALIYDDRISDVTDFEVERNKDNLFVSFRVIHVDGEDVQVQEVL